jgi:hypothetical protein
LEGEEEKKLREDLNKSIINSEDLIRKLKDPKTYGFYL